MSRLSAIAVGDEASGFASAPHLNVATVAKMISVAPSTLRTWDRRYGLGPSVHESGTHRKYASEDVSRLLVMRLWIFRGASSGQAAEYAKNADVTSLIQAELQAELDQEIDSHESVGAGVVIDVVPQGGPVRVAEATPLGKVSHLRVAPEHTGNQWQERCSQLVTGALRNDPQSCLEALRLGRDTDLIQWWKRLVRPALERISSHTLLALPGQSPRHLVGQVVLGELARFGQSQDGPPAGHPSRLRNLVLVFTPASDNLSLSAHVMGAALTAANLNANLVAGPAEPDRIAELVAMVRPVAAVFVADQQAPNVEVLERLVADFPQLPVFIGLGDGDVEKASAAPTSVMRVRSFTALFHEVVAVASQPAFGADYWDNPSRTVSLQHLK